ncbi:hypothetical protein DAEQUDRAFT_761661 [Daedalea quercina L-15889]|uniref:DUF6533 domain-containing protein n=1 Tax=Daedalea quercina L-15889 TaxID=1314783 RepID=A0A165U0W7_9APHY|nr:hypothetical protein DAEQUDRAFT_761661 [Daedalea quercina L-15889]
MATNPQPIYQLNLALRQNYLLVAPFALYAYDRLLTFNHEVDLMWRWPGRRRTCLVPILYAMMHICTPLYFIINIASWWDLDCKRFVKWRQFAKYEPDERYSIYVLNLAYGADVCVLYLTWGAISALRVYAINRRGWFIPSVIFALSLVPVATNLHRNILMIWEVLSPYTCTITNNVPARVQSICAPALPVCRMPSSYEPLFTVEIATRVSAIVVDALVLLATWRVTYGIKRMSLLLQSNIPITLLLLRDGSLYFGSLFALNIFSAVCWAKIAAFQDFDNFIYSLTTVLLSRLFFDLREVSLLQSVRCADAENTFSTDTHSLSCDPQERTQFSTDASGFWTQFTTLGALGGSVALMDAEHALPESFTEDAETALEGIPPT